MIDTRDVISFVAKGLAGRGRSAGEIAAMLGRLHWLNCFVEYDGEVIVIGAVAGAKGAEVQNVLAWLRRGSYEIERRYNGEEDG